MGDALAVRVVIDSAREVCFDGDDARAGSILTFIVRAWGWQINPADVSDGNSRRSNS